MLTLAPLATTALPTPCRLCLDKQRTENSQIQRFSTQSKNSTHRTIQTYPPRYITDRFFATRLGLAWYSFLLLLLLLTMTVAAILVFSFILAAAGLVEVHLALLTLSHRRSSCVHIDH